MSGKISVEPRIVISHDEKWDSYVGWMLRVQGEDGRTVTLMPKYIDMLNMFSDILTHEFLVDETRGRNPDFTRWRKWCEKLPQLAREQAQRRFDEFIKTKIPEIYFKPKRTDR